MTEAPDPFFPAAEHATLLASAREQARVDAARHGEDLLSRPLPFVKEAGFIASRRIALLTARRAELASTMQAAVDSAAREEEFARARVTSTERALAAAGVPAEERVFGPLARPMSWLQPVALAVAGALLSVGVATVLDARLPGILVLLWSCAALCVLACQRVEESARIGGLRRERMKAVRALLDAARVGEEARAALTSFPLRAQALLRAEVALGGELAAAYVTALMSALATGALADGAAVTDQPDPEIVLPAWGEATT